MREDSEFRELILTELHRIREKQDSFMKELSEMKLDLAVHKTKTSLFAMILGAVSGFIAHLISK